MASWFGPLSAFVAVLLLIPVALWLLKRTPLGQSASGVVGMRVVAALAVAPNQRLLTVEVGSGAEQRWLVLGVSPAGIQTLHTMLPAVAPVAAGGPGANTGTQASTGIDAFHGR